MKENSKYELIDKMQILVFPLPDMNHEPENVMAAMQINEYLMSVGLGRLSVEDTMTLAHSSIEDLNIFKNGLEDRYQQLEDLTGGYPLFTDAQLKEQSQRGEPIVSTDKLRDEFVLLAVKDSFLSEDGNRCFSKNDEIDKKIKENLRKDGIIPVLPQSSLLYKIDEPLVLCDDKEPLIREQCVKKFENLTGRPLNLNGVDIDIETMSKFYDNYSRSAFLKNDAFVKETMKAITKSASQEYSNMARRINNSMKRMDIFVNGKIENLQSFKNDVLAEQKKIHDLKQEYKNLAKEGEETIRQIEEQSEIAREHGAPSNDIDEYDANTTALTEIFVEISKKMKACEKKLEEEKGNKYFAIGNVLDIASSAKQNILDILNSSKAYLYIKGRIVVDGLKHALDTIKDANFRYKIAGKAAYEGLGIKAAKIHYSVRKACLEVDIDQLKKLEKTEKNINNWRVKVQKAQARTKLAIAALKGENGWSEYQKNITDIDAALGGSAVFISKQKEELKKEIQKEKKKLEDIKIKLATTNTPNIDKYKLIQEIINKDGIKSEKYKEAAQKIKGKENSENDIIHEFVHTDIE